MEQITDTLYSWASILEPSTREQAVLASGMPFIHPHIALMPDAHLGRGATVGSVIPTKGAIMPAAVGVDIGCGMIAWRLDVLASDLPGDRARVREQIERAIPLSAGRYNARVDQHAETRVATLEADAQERGFDPAAYAKNWRLQLGSLGSGNHFIEISLDEQDRVWLFLHSGSRGVGNKIAQHHIGVAQKVMRDNGIGLPDRDLAYLTEGSDEFADYISQMQWAQHFALLNREVMMHRVYDQVSRWLGESPEDGPRVTQEVNCHHNYTVPETHGGEQVWLSRKGAISAWEGEWGLIPGSMGARSYVVQGRGNAAALMSAPHGAGREYSRSRARREFTLADLEAAMGDIEYRHTEAFVDEIPAAYKDIDVVMRDAEDLVTIRHTLRQIVNVKAD